MNIIIAICEGLEGRESKREGKGAAIHCAWDATLSTKQGH